MKIKSKSILTIVILTFIIIVIKFFSTPEGTVINLNEPAFFFIGASTGLLIARSEKENK